MNKDWQLAQKILDEADVKINGTRDWDIQVKNDKLFTRVLAGGSLALGESYMDDWWDVKQMDEFFYRLLSARLDQKVRPTFQLIARIVAARLFNSQKKSKAFEVGEQHYDVGNDIYEKMLDKRMVYTCGYWKGLEWKPENLDAAQEAKLDLVCKKIGLKKGGKVLDIGGGWGSFAKFAAEKYGAETVTITVSKEQIELGKKMCEGLPVKFRFLDYRDLDGKEKFDHIVSLGMFEHVGEKNYRQFMKVAHSALKDDGLFLLHTIGTNQSILTSDPWINKYIFPNSMLPSPMNVGKSIDNLFVMEDWHNFSINYYPTLMAWMHNFDKAWPELKEKYGDRFYRMWRFYLMASAATFKVRDNQLWQIVLSKGGIPGGYDRIS